MGESNQASVSSLPLPPMQYINLYTDENMKRGKAPPPPMPVKDQYTMFGVGFHADDAIIRPLESQGIRRLYPMAHDPKREMKKINHSILVNFLDLLDSLIRAPDSPKRTEKIEDMGLLFTNMHHLINEFRPHQARETLRVMLEAQKNQRLETAERFQKYLEKVQEILHSTLQSLPDESSLEYKPTIKTEPGDGAYGHALHNGLTNGIKQEDDDEPAIDPMDSMMCDVVDEMN